METLIRNILVFPETSFTEALVVFLLALALSAHFLGFFLLFLLLLLTDLLHDLRSLVLFVKLLHCHLSRCQLVNLK